MSLASDMIMLTEVAVLGTAVMTTMLVAAMQMVMVLAIVIMRMMMVIPYGSDVSAGFYGRRCFTAAAFDTHQSISSSLRRICSPAVTCS